MAAKYPIPCHVLMISSLRLSTSNMQNKSFIAYSELMGMASDRIDGNVIVVTGDEKDIFDGAFGYVKLRLN